MRTKAKPMPVDRRTIGDRFTEYLALVASVEARYGENIYQRRGAGFDQHVYDELLHHIDFSRWPDAALEWLMRTALEHADEDHVKALAAKIGHELADARYFLLHGHCAWDAPHHEDTCAACARARGAA